MLIPCQCFLQSYHLVCDLSRKGNIDESHNEIHSKENLFWATELMKRSPKKWTSWEYDMIGHCSILHDMMDHKYTDYSEIVKDHLQQKFTEEETTDMMIIMKSMSYSKTMIDEKPVFPDWLNQSGLENIYHTVREADLLSSYNLARIIYYSQNKHPEYSDRQLKQEVKELFYKRMDKLIDRGFFVSNESISLATSVHEVTKLKLFLVDHIDIQKNIDILKIVDTKTVPIEKILSDYTDRIV